MKETIDINCLTECDVLAASTLAAKQIACCIKDQDTLNLAVDLIIAIGDTLSLIAGQRARFTQNCKKETPTSTDTQKTEA